MNKQRVASIEKEIKKVVSNLFFNEVKNPKIRGIISIPKVNLSGDSRHCKIFVSVLNEDENFSSKVFQKGLDEIKRFVRRRVADEIRLRYTPEIDLVYDNSIEEGIRINKKINELTK